MSNFSRRRFLGGSVALAGAALFGRAGDGPAYARTLPPSGPAGVNSTTTLDLIAQERRLTLPCFNGRDLPLWTFTANAMPPVVRMRLGQRLNAHVENHLTRPGEHISIHWHGIRLPNDQDGVPYLVQAPIEPGNSFDYSFIPPDTGTFFFHTHCNTIEQLGRGLYGILIIDGDAPEPYDADEIIVLKDWRVDEARQNFLPFMTTKGAGQAGTFGTVRSVNGAERPQITVPSAADVRLRVVNVDPTRVSEIGVEGAEAAVVAIDGIACLPFPLRSWRMGPAMRVDLIVRTPGDGGTVTIVDYFAARPITLATLKASGPARRQGAFDPAPLAAGRMPVPAIASAATLPFSFSATATGQSVTGVDAAYGPLGPLCLSAGNLWAINKQSWPGSGMDQLPPPIARLERGKSYVFELTNVTPRSHPIHIHGHSFTVLGSDKRVLPPHHADTVLLVPNETIRAAFVADNPGRWMMHCHIIEHQETGMMAWFEVA